MTHFFIRPRLSSRAITRSALLSPLRNSTNSQRLVNSRIVMETNLKIVRTRNLLALRFLRDIARDNHGLLSPELLPSRTQDTISGTRAAHEFCGSEIMDAVCSNVVSTEDARTSYLHILTVLRENELIYEVEEHSV
jgi:hypothetical protein